MRTTGQGCGDKVRGVSTPTGSRGKHSANPCPVHSPCEAAAKASMACLDRYDYKREYCADFFTAYRDCKKTWVGAIPFPFLS